LLFINHRLGKDNIAYLEATGNSTKAENSLQIAKDDFNQLRRKYLDFIESLENIDQSLAIKCSKYLSIQQHEDSAEILFAEALKVCVLFLYLNYNYVCTQFLNQFCVCVHDTNKLRKLFYSVTSKSHKVWVIF